MGILTFFGNKPVFMALGVLVKPHVFDWVWIFLSYQIDFQQGYGRSRKRGKKRRYYPTCPVRNSPSVSLEHLGTGQSDPSNERSGEVVVSPLLF